MSLDIDVVIWWALVDGDPSFPYSTGLITKDEEWIARPSYIVYQQVVKRLGPSEFIEVTVKPTAENDLEAYRFRDKRSNQTFYVAWLNPVAPLDVATLSTFQDDDTQALQLPGTTATIIAKEGHNVAVLHDGDDGTLDAHVTVQVGRNPIYIVMD